MSLPRGGVQGGACSPLVAFSRAFVSARLHGCRRPRTDRLVDTLHGRISGCVGTERLPVLAGWCRPARRPQRPGLCRDIRTPATLPCRVDNPCRARCTASAVSPGVTKEAPYRPATGRAPFGQAFRMHHASINGSPAEPATVSQPGPAVAQGAGVSPSRVPGLGDRNGFPSPRGDGSHRSRGRVDGITPAIAEMMTMVQARVSGPARLGIKSWIPAFAGMTGDLAGDVTSATTVAPVTAVIPAKAGIRFSRRVPKIEAQETSAPRRAREHPASRPSGRCGEGADIVVRTGP